MNIVAEKFGYASPKLPAATSFIRKTLYASGFGIEKVYKSKQFIINEVRKYGRRNYVRGIQKSV